MTTPEELRTLVAEEVMGWGKGAFHFVTGVKTQRWFDDEECLVADGFRPLESWADAGRVYDSMLARGWLVTTAADATGWTTCIVTDSETYRELAKVCGKDWKEAISLAALRALGVEVE